MIHFENISKPTKNLAFASVLALSLASCKTDPPAAEIKSASTVTSNVVPAEQQSTIVLSNTEAPINVEEQAETKENIKENLSEENPADTPKETLSETTVTTSIETVTPKKKVVTKKSLPQINFDQIRYDFGEINQGDTVDYKFKFLNTGNAPLVVNNVKATCGCTQPSYPFIPIEAGEEGHVGVRYISVGKEGLQKPLITVYTNASKDPITLMFSGKVNVPAKVKKDSSKAEKVIEIDTLVKGN